MNVNQRNRGAMSPDMPQEFRGIAKFFCLQISRREKAGQPPEHRGIVVEETHNKGIGV
jgi:hypothetical protein